EAPPRAARLAAELLVLAHGGYLVLGMGVQPYQSKSPPGCLLFPWAGPTTVFLLLSNRTYSRMRIDSFHSNCATLPPVAKNGPGCAPTRTETGFLTPPLGTRHAGDGSAADRPRLAPSRSQ